MDKSHTLIAQKRALFGRKVKQLRTKKVIPANIFGNGFDSLAVQVDQLAFVKMYKEVGESSLIDIQVEGDKTQYPALISNVSRHPFTEAITHIDFRKVDLKQKISTHVPLKFEGDSEAVNSKGAVLLTTLEEVEVEALPSNLPEFISVDLSKLVEIGDTITVADLVVDSDVTIETDPETTVAVAQEHVEEAEPEPVATEEAPAAEATSAAAEEAKPAQE